MKAECATDKEEWVLVQAAMTLLRGNPLWCLWSNYLKTTFTPTGWMFNQPALLHIISVLKESVPLSNVIVILGN